MAETTSQQSSRYSKRRQRHKRDNDHCQYWDMKTGGCDSDGVTSLKYTMSGEKYSWWFCQKHYAKKRRQVFGCCSYRWTDGEGKSKRCSSLRATNTRGKARKSLGYCRRHEGEFLRAAGDRKVSDALGRVSGLITVKSDTGCWIVPERENWTTRRLFRCGGKQWTSYRLMFVYFYGGHANGLELAHDCDDKLCCNPMHVTPLKPRMNRDAEHDITAKVFWAVAATFKRPSPELQVWADTHGLPLYGAETSRIVDKFFPSEEVLTARYWADLEADELEDRMALAV